MALTLDAGIVRIDVARVPVGGSRDIRVASAPVVVDARHHAVKAILETSVKGIDLRGRRQSCEEDVAALLGTEERRVQSGDLRDYTRGRGYRIEKVVRHSHGIVPVPR